MSKTTRILILFNLAALLLYFGFTVYQKEMLLKRGTLLLLELAPVDPRSLMQGDYMQLRYSFSNQSQPAMVREDTLPKRGYAVLKVNAEGIASLQRTQTSRKPLEAGEYLVSFTRPGHEIFIGAESFFFQEGTGHLYENAKYGGLRVDDRGNSLLVGLFNDQQKMIAPTTASNK